MIPVLSPYLTRKILATMITILWSNQACKIHKECADEITEELHSTLLKAPRALNIQPDPAWMAESESVHFGIIGYLLDRDGVSFWGRYLTGGQAEVERILYLYRCYCFNSCGCHTLYVLS